MNRFSMLVLSALALSACTDQGVEPYIGWDAYDLPYAQILVPPDFYPIGRVMPIGQIAIPENPVIIGGVGDGVVVIQLCIYTPFGASMFRDYQEESIMHHGHRAVIFRGLGSFRPYDSHFSNLIGMRAYFNSDGTESSAVIKYYGPEGESLAYKILMSMHPAPHNTGKPL
ncbi:MAG: hypothetical protein IPI01_06430 [Ignavibacteriae bacterium]|nr:hypothetical protein [Ignavibacteriota bacterium]